MTRKTPRSIAKYSGETFYFTGKKCVNGHVANRLTINGSCCECTKERSLSSEFKKVKKIYAEKNKEKIKIEAKKYYEQNKEKIKARALVSHRKNRDKRLSAMSDYCQRTKEKRRPYLAKWNRDKRSSSVEYRMRCIMRNNINRCVRRGLFKKENSVLKTLGYSPSDLVSHLESLFSEGMSWDNYGDWEIDHIVPLSAFDLTNSDEVKKANELDNLQPMWLFENRSKGAKQYESL